MDEAVRRSVTCAAADERVRSQRPRRARHRRQPGARSEHGAGVRPRRSRRADRQPQARELQERGRAWSVRETGRRAVALPVSRRALGRRSRRSSASPTASSGGSTCWSTTPACPRSTNRSATSPRSCGGRCSTSTSRALPLSARWSELADGRRQRWLDHQHHERCRYCFPARRDSLRGGEGGTERDDRRRLPARSGRACGSTASSPARS